ncbi:hypothetical protein DL96DRAFT_1617040 [Flagelloscypha sp. PMI_526]|nr:hypothetical protein DL96DRAFT_1617040 [Flagelloscypha sp. PMI_526]
MRRTNARVPMITPAMVPALSWAISLSPIVVWPLVAVGEMVRVVIILVAMILPLASVVLLVNVSVSRSNSKSPGATAVSGGLVSVFVADNVASVNGIGLVNGLVADNITPDSGIVNGIVVVDMGRIRW